MPRLPGASPGKKKGRAQRGEKAAKDKGMTKPAAPMAPPAKPVAPAAAPTGGGGGGSQAAAAATVVAPAAAEERAAKPLELTAARLRLICSLISPDLPLTSS